VNILTIDTANALLCLSLQTLNGIFFYTSETQNYQCEEIVLQINNLLQKANTKLQEIHYFGINLGPGSFTGVRIATAYLSGLLAFNPDKKIIQIDTFDISLEDFLSKNKCHHEVIDIIFKADIGSGIFIKSYNLKNNTKSIEKYIKTEEFQEKINTLYLLEEVVFHKINVINKELCSKISPLGMQLASIKNINSAESLDKIKIISPKYLRQPF